LTRSIVLSTDLISCSIETRFTLFTDQPSTATSELRHDPSVFS